MRTYRPEEILKRVKSLSSFRGIPSEYWICGIRSKQDVFDKFDDMFYLFKGEKMIMTLTGTTNPGKTALKNYMTYNRLGAAIVKSDEWYKDLWSYGLHKGRMQALKQISGIKYYRDGNKNDRSEEIGKEYLGIIGINFHGTNYDWTNDSHKSTIIGGWSAGCQVANVFADYKKLINFVRKQSRVTYCLIREF